MALINCRECGKQISDQAASCPHCGAPVRQAEHRYEPPPRAAKARGMGWFAKGSLIVVALVAAFLIFGMTRPPTARTEARRQCDTIERLAYTPSEKARAAELCGELMREADRKMGLIR